VPVNSSAAGSIESMLI